MFDVGDVVRLNSGGPLMTVDYLRDDSTIQVVWFAGDELRRDAFEAQELLSMSAPITRTGLPLQSEDASFHSVIDPAGCVTIVGSEGAQGVRYGEDA